MPVRLILIGALETSLLSIGLMRLLAVVLLCASACACASMFVWYCLFSLKSYGGNVILVSMIQMYNQNPQHLPKPSQVQGATLLVSTCPASYLRGIFCETELCDAQHDWFLHERVPSYRFHV